MPPLDSNLNKNQLAVDFPIQIIKHFACGEAETPDDGKSIRPERCEDVKDKSGEACDVEQYRAGVDNLAPC